MGAYRIWIQCTDVSDKTWYLLDMPVESKYLQFFLEATERVCGCQHKCGEVLLSWDLEVLKK